MSVPRIYLDNAATSFPKPEAVYQAVERYQRELGSAVGRSTGRIAGDVQQVIDRCRQRAARLFAADHPDQILFTQNGTEALNLAILGLLREQDRVIISPWEHNSVLRPLHRLAQTKNAQVEMIRDDGRGGIDLDSLRELLGRPARLLVLTHASNVTGIVQPIHEAARLAHDSGTLVLLDAAQTAGHLPVRFSELPVDLIACPGHKGLLGPLGTGLLALRSGLEQTIEPLRFGGTGTLSESEQQPESGPERYESGNHNAPGLFGLEAALAWLESRQQQGAALHEHEQALTCQFLSGLAQLPRVRILPGSEEVPRVGVVSFLIEGVEPHVLANLLDGHFGIETRAGLHCAPRAHHTLGTFPLGGTVRVSFGPFTTADQIDASLTAIGEIAVSL